MDRLRWDNIGRVAAVLAVIALVVAWPHLRGAPPSLPPAAATPVSVEQPAPPVAAQRPRAKRKRPRARPPRPAAPRPREQHAPRVVPTRRAPVTVAPAPVAPAPPPPTPSTSDLAAREFAVP